MADHAAAMEHDATAPRTGDLVLVRNTHLPNVVSDSFADETASMPILVFVASMVLIVSPSSS